MVRTPPHKVSELLVKRLTEEQEQGRLTFHRHTNYRGPGSPVRYVFDTADERRRVFDTMGTWAWLHGRDAGQLAKDSPWTDVDEALDPLREFLETPRFVDQVRLQLWLAMETQGVGVVEMARRTGLTRKTIADSLRFGTSTSLSTSTAEAMFAALPGDWPRRQIVPQPDERARDLHRHRLAAITPLHRAMPHRGQPEPAGIARARAAAIVHDAAWVRYLGPLEPDKALRAAHFRFDVPGLGERKVLSPVVLEWLTGVADGAGDPTTADAITPSR